MHVISFDRHRLVPGCMTQGKLNGLQGARTAAAHLRLHGVATSRLKCKSRQLQSHQSTSTQVLTQVTIMPKIVPVLS